MNKQRIHTITIVAFVIAVIGLWFYFILGVMQFDETLRAFRTEQGLQPLYPYVRLMWILACASMSIVVLMFMLVVSLVLSTSQSEG